MKNNYDEETILQVLKAYLVDSLSQRDIQKKILNIPAPLHGGGYESMNILHSYGIKGEHKGVLSKIAEENSLKNPIKPELFKKIMQYVNTEKEAEEKIHEKNFYYEDKETEKTTNSKTRIYQDVLRKIILNNYQNKCALCSIDKSDLLICSHIVPWSIDSKNRLNPQNAICLCALHDKLFDKGYFSLNDNYEIIYSTKADVNIKEMFKNLSFKKPICDHPDVNFIKYHRKEVCNINE